MINIRIIDIWVGKFKDDGSFLCGICRLDNRHICGPRRKSFFRPMRILDLTIIVEPMLEFDSVYYWITILGAKSIYHLAFFQREEYWHSVRFADEADTQMKLEIFVRTCSKFTVVKSVCCETSMIHIYQGRFRHRIECDIV
jgi:hypothetical protein